jgi:Fe-S cluster biosynthesis and repair protein YggX
MKHFKLVLIALSFALLFISSHAMAQYKDKDATDIQKFGEEIVKLDDLYVRPTFENLSKLYWELMNVVSTVIINSMNLNGAMCGLRRAELLRKKKMIFLFALESCVQ